MNNHENKRYVTGLDGIRALAIFFIIAYHFSFSWANGGFLGVDIFFVLSGYLITSRILKSEENEPDFNLKKFWSGRIRRLLPAYYAMIIIVVVWVILFNKEILTTLLGDAAASVSYAANWWFIFHKLSYFDSFGTPSPLKHLWYMAVQEQFFFLWSIVLIKGLGFFKKRKNFLMLTIIVSLCSVLLMGMMYNPDADPSRVYYGTDTRSFELLIGGLMAAVSPVEKLSPKEISAKQRLGLNIVGIITLAVFILSAVLVNEYQPFLYRGGFFLFSLNAALLIACVCHPLCFISGILSWKPLRWIGTRSYGIYLWHYPIMALTTPVFEIGNPSYWHVGLQLTAACIIAELSYRFIETPIRQLGFRGFFRKYMSFHGFKWGQETSVKKISAVAAALVIIALVFGSSSWANNEKKAEETETPAAMIMAGSEDQGVSKNDSVISSEEKDTTGTRGEAKASPAANDSSCSNDTSNPNPHSLNKSYKEILAIGDSIMLNIESNLEEKYSNITVDGKVSRQMSAAIELAPAYTEFNDAQKAVILELGTNGYFTENQIDSLLDSFTKADIYLVNTRVPRRWEKTVNELLKKKADERGNVVLVDWYSTAINHPEYFGDDGVHLTSSGREALTNLISEDMEGLKVLCKSTVPVT